MCHTECSFKSQLRQTEWRTERERESNRNRNRMSERQKGQRQETTHNVKRITFELMNSTFSPIHSAKEPKLCNSFPSFSFSASLFSSTRFFVRLFLLLCSFSLPFLWMNLTRENTKHSNKNRNFIYDFQNSQRLNRMCAKHENFCTVNVVRLSYSVSLSLSLFFSPHLSHIRRILLWLESFLSCIRSVLSSFGVGFLDLHMPKKWVREWKKNMNQIQQN